MRALFCLIPLLGIPLLAGCSTPSVRCDAHLQAINPPTAPADTQRSAP